VDGPLVEGLHVMSADLPAPPRFLDAVRADLREIAKEKGARWPSLGGVADVLTLPGAWAVFLFRVASTLHHRGLRPLSRLVFFANVVLFSAELHPGAIAGPGLVIPHTAGVGIASGTVLGARVRMLRGTAVGGAGNPKRPGLPVIGDDVWILDSAKVLGPAHIGDRTMIGTNAVVVDDIPEDVFVFGARKSSEYRPLAELGLGEAAEAEHGYGRQTRLRVAGGRG
jgi:serine O-acetyltransferase